MSNILQQYGGLSTWSNSATRQMIQVLMLSVNCTERRICENLCLGSVKIYVLKIYVLSMAYESGRWGNPQDTPVLGNSIQHV